MRLIEEQILPTGWKWVKLGDLSHSAKGSFRIGPFGSSLNKEELSNHGIPVVGIENVLVNRFEPQYRRFISQEKYAQLFDYKIESGDILVSTMGTIGRAAVVPNGADIAIIDSHLFRMRLDRSKADPYYVCFTINGNIDLRRQLDKKSSGAIMAGLNTKILKECVIPLPPLPEQNRIVAILTEKMAVVEKARLAAEERLKAAKELPAAYLREVFESDEAQGWPNMSLREACEIQLGKMLSPKSKTGKASQPYLRNANVQWNKFNLSNIAEMDFNPVEQKKFLLCSGDIMVCEGGEPGRAAVWQNQISPCYYQKALHRLRPINGSCDPYFIMLRLWYGGVTSEFSESHAKTTIAHLPVIRLASLNIGLPPITNIVQPSNSLT